MPRAIRDYPIVDLIRGILPGINSRQEDARDDYGKWRNLLTRGQAGRAGGPQGPVNPNDPRSRLADITDILAGNNPAAAGQMLMASLTPKETPTTPKITEREHLLGLTQPQRDILNPPDAAPPAAPDLQYLNKVLELIAGGDAEGVDAAYRLKRQQPEQANAIAEGAATAAAANRPLSAFEQQMAAAGTPEGADWSAMMQASRGAGSTTNVNVNPDTKPFLKAAAEGQTFFTGGGADAARTAISGLNEMLNHESFGASFGTSNIIAGTAALAPNTGRRDFKNIKDRTVGAEVLKAIASFKGAISDKDLALAETATAVLRDSGSSDEQARKALVDLKRVYEQALERNKRKANIGDEGEYRSYVQELTGANDNSGWSAALVQ